MKILNIMIIILLLVTCNVDIASSLEIVEPTERQVFEYGSKIRFVIKPQIGETWIGVRIGLQTIPYDDNSGAFVGEYTLSNALKPGDIELKIIAISESKQITELRRTIVLSVSPNVTLQSIDVDPNPLLLYKLPPDSDPDKIRIFETKRLVITGIYSDGVRRELATNTMYLSHNENIATVSADGKVTAHNIGNTTITVSNGIRKKDIPVIVKQYKSL